MPFNLHFRKTKVTPSQLNTIEDRNKRDQSSYSNKGITFSRNKRVNSISAIMAITGVTPDYTGPSPASYCPMSKSKSIEYSFGKRIDSTVMGTPGPGSYLGRLDSRGANVIARYKRIRSCFMKQPVEKKAKIATIIRNHHHPGPCDYEILLNSSLLSEHKRTPTTVFQRATRFK